MDISQIVPCTERAFEKGRGDGREEKARKGNRIGSKMSGTPDPTLLSKTASTIDSKGRRITGGGTIVMFFGAANRDVTT